MKNYKIYMESDDKELIIEVGKEIDDRKCTIFKFFTDSETLGKVVSKKIPKEPHLLMKYFIGNQTSKKLHVII